MESQEIKMLWRKEKGAEIKVLKGSMGSTPEIFRNFRAAELGEVLFANFAYTSSQPFCPEYLSIFF